MTPSEQEAWRAKGRESNRKYRAENPEKTRELGRKYYEANREKRRESVRKWLEANSEKQRESARKHYAANSEKQRESARKAAKKAKQQTAADQFFIMAGAAEQLTKLKPKQ